MKNRFIALRNWFLMLFKETKVSKTYENVIEKDLKPKEEEHRKQSIKAGMQGEPNNERQCASFILVCAAYLTAITSNLDQDILKKYAELKIVNKKLQKGEQGFIAEEEERAKPELRAIYNKHNSVINEDEERLHQLGNERAEIEADLYIMDKPPFTSLLDNKWASLSIKTVMVLIDIPVLAHLSEVMGVNHYGIALLFGFLAAGLLAFFAFVTADNLRKSKKGFKAVFVFGYSYLAILIIARIILDADFWYITAPLLFVLYSLSIIIDLRLNKYAEYFENKAKAKKNRREQEIHRKSINTQQSMGAQEIESLLVEAREQGKKNYGLALQKQTDLQTGIQSDEITRNTATQLVNNYKEQAIIKLDTAFEEGRRRLPLRHSGNSTDNNFLRKISIFLLSFSILTLSGCSTTTDNTVVVGILTDYSNSVKHQYLATPEEQSNQLFGDFQLADISSEGIRGSVIFSEISGAILPKRTTVSLEEIAPLFSRDRIKSDSMVKAFKDDITKVADSIYNNRRQAASTNVYFSLAGLLNELAVTQAQKKLVYVLTDGIEESALADFTEYSYNSKALLDNYDVIKKQFTDVIPLQPLNNIEIVFVYPDSGGNTLAFYSREFWKRLLSEQGAQVRFQANL